MREGARMSAEFRRLTRCSGGELDRLFLQGSALEPTALPGALYLGWNCPAWAEVLRIRKFVTGFTAVEGGVLGHNIPVRQNGVDGDWEPLPAG